MKEVLKFNLKSETTLRLPVGAKVLCVQTQHEEPRLWILVDPDDGRLVDRTFVTVSTGYEIPYDADEYIGTFQLGCGQLVCHVFERKEAV